MFANATAAIAEHVAQNACGEAGPIAVPLFVFGWKTRNTSAMLAALAMIAMALGR